MLRLRLRLMLRLRLTLGLGLGLGVIIFVSYTSDPRHFHRQSGKAPFEGLAAHQAPWFGLRLETSVFLPHFFSSPADGRQPDRFHKVLFSSRFC